MGDIEQEIIEHMKKMMSEDPADVEKATECRCITDYEHFKIYEIIDNMSPSRPLIAYDLEQWANRNWCLMNECFKKMKGIKK